MTRKIVLGAAMALVLNVMAQDNLMMLVGTYTDGGSRGVYSYCFNQNTGESALLDSLQL